MAGDTGLLHRRLLRQLLRAAQVRFVGSEVGASARLDPCLKAELYAISRAAALLSGVGVASAVGGLVFNVAVARAAGVEAYGAVGALLSLGTIAGFLATGSQYAVARSVATLRVRPGVIMSKALAANLPWLAIAALWMVLCHPIAEFLHLGSALPVIVAGLLAAVVIVSAIPAGLLIGQRRFGAIAILGIAAIALRLGGTALVSRNAHAITVALTVSAVPIIIMSVASLLVALRGATAGAECADAHLTSVGLAREGATGAVLSAGLWTVWSLPLIAARHGLEGRQAGMFAAIQLLASGILFLTAPIVTVFHPAVARTGHWGTISTGAVGTFVVALLAGSVLTITGPWIMEILYGHGYAADRSVLAAFSVSAGCVAVGTYVLWVSRALQRGTRLVAAAIVVWVAIELSLTALLPPSLFVLAASPGLSLLLAGGLAATSLWVTLGRRLRFFWTR